MSRKPISDDVQNGVLLKSRRRCCLCFWLSGVDEVQKGQIAHLDQNNENAEEDNLVFLCFNHHDEYDGKTSQSKGLREDEVRKWRDELYREMESRFRTFRKRELQLTVLGVILAKNEDLVTVKFRLKNTGEVEARRPHVSIRLPEGVSGEVPRPKKKRYEPAGGGMMVEMHDFPDMWGMTESREDFFEENGRVGMVNAVGGVTPVLLVGHSTTFNGLGIHLKQFGKGAVLNLEYRIDAEGLVPIIGTIEVKLPENQEDLLADDE